MKRLIIALVLLLLWSLSGCKNSDLLAYQNAIELSEQIPMGEQEMKLNMDITFNQDGLSFENKRDLSYFENLDLVFKSKYKEEDGDFKMIADIYSSIGGMGYDMTMYAMNDQQFMEIPVLDGYISMADTSNVQKNTQNYEDNGELIGEIIDRWNAILQEDDVFSGKKDYIFTDKGQIKTTTYNITINAPQFQVLKEAFLELINEKGLIESFVNANAGFGEGLDVEVMRKQLSEVMENLELVNFEGTAYVDFDGRLAKHVIDVELVNKAAKPGDVSTIHVIYEVTYDNLGDVQDFEIPKVSPEDFLDMDAFNNIDSLF